MEDVYVDVFFFKDVHWNSDMKCHIYSQRFNSYSFGRALSMAMPVPSGCRPFKADLHFFIYKSVVNSKNNFSCVSFHVVRCIANIAYMIPECPMHLVWESRARFDKKTHKMTFDEFYRIHINGLFIFIIFAIDPIHSLIIFFHIDITRRASSLFLLFDQDFFCWEHISSFQHPE